MTCFSLKPVKYDMINMYVLCHFDGIIKWFMKISRVNLNFRLPEVNRTLKKILNKLESEVMFVLFGIYLLKIQKGLFKKITEPIL